MLEAHPELATADFSQRIMAEAQDCEDRAIANVLSQTAQLTTRVVAAGVDVAAKEKLGESGVRAGFAREARGRYYETKDRGDLSQALEHFHQALLHDDDPVLYGQGDTLQGFAATLSDFTQLIKLPLLEHVGLLAFLASITMRVAGVPPAADASWSDPIARALTGVRGYLDTLEQMPLEERAADFYSSVRHACEALEEVLHDGPPEPALVLKAAMPVLSLALTCSRAEVPVPRSDTSIDAKLEEISRVWLSIVLSMIERYGSDCLRFSLAQPVDDPELLMRSGEPDYTAPEPLAADPDLSVLAAEVAQALDEKLAAMEDGDQTGNCPAIDELLFLAVQARPWAPEQARALAQVADSRLGERDNERRAAHSAPAALLSSRSTLKALTTAVAALVDTGATQVERFGRIREVLPVELVEGITAALEAELDEMPPARAGDSPTPRMLTLAHLMVVVRDLSGAVMTSSSLAALPTAERYRAVHDRVRTLTTGDDDHPTGFLVHPDVPGREEMQSLAMRFQEDFASLDLAEASEIASWLAAAYEMGGLKFAAVENELTLLNNLGCIAVQAGRLDALKWTARARRLALEQGAWTFVAIADINAASCYSDAIDRYFSTWSVDAEHAAARIGLGIAGLAHTAEALRIVSGGAGLSDPTDRYFLHSIGFTEIRTLIEGLLVQVRDAALLAEYLLNARGMWFLLDLYHQHDRAEFSQAVIGERSVVSWRDRCWPAISLAIDERLGTDRAIPHTDLKDILAPTGKSDALWFGNVFDEVSRTLASVLIAPPKDFIAEFDALGSPAESLREMCSLDVATTLGALLPVTLWQLADQLRAAGERATLFVSLANELPPVAMGLWRRNGAGDARVVTDAFDVVYCPTLAPRSGTLRWTEQRRAARPQVFSVCDPLGDLPEARVVPRLVTAICGNGAQAGANQPANPETVLALIQACSRADGVFLYQGHSESGVLEDPEAASLLLEPVKPGMIAAERLNMGALIRTLRRSSSGNMPRRAAFLSCGSGVASQRHDATGIAMAALAGGAEAVVSTLKPISDDGPWNTLVDDLVSILISAEPWREFGRWQRQIARRLEGLDESTRGTVASLTMFGTPFIRPVSAGPFP